ncbi:Gfo/Idh/MocA family protein [Rubrivirga sp. IMCC43871]|uniref:Gfo/Idh/MocA family protein n=1 Tax=Rubrivirga sp. IMCC43871 TaxID=3391575 RepID=UPI003990029D
MTQVGLIGCGDIAESVHLDALSRVSGVRVVALAEPDATRREAAARRVPGATPYASAGALLADPAVEAVVIATPPATHADLAVAAFEAGKHVYLEKPIATRRADAERVVEACRSAGTVGAVGFNYRFHPLVEAAQSQVARVGALVAVRTVFTSAARPLPDWKTRRATGGGVLLDLGSHHADLVRHLTGQAFVSVWTDVQDEADAEGVTAAVTGRLDGGATVQMMVSLRATDEDRVEIIGRDGRLRYDRLRSASPVVEAPAFAYGRPAQIRRVARAVRDGVRRTLATPGDASFVRSFAAFAEACAGRRPAALATLEDGCRSLAFVEAAAASARTGSPVTVGPRSAD